MSSGPPSRHFYLIAIGGTAMTPLAGLLCEKGETVLGSDLLPLYPPMSDRLAALGLTVLPGFRAENLPSGVDRVVVGNLAGKDNPELVEALARGLRVTSMPETLREEILPGRHPVVIAGTHGKTTTTAFTAWLLASAGRAPGYLIGGEPRNFPSPSVLGTGAAFVIEGDEYSTSYADKGPKFLHYAPRTLVLTSVEFDHADLYADLDAVKDAFRKGVALVPEDGLIVAAAGDRNIDDVLAGAGARVVRYGLEDASADVAAWNVVRHGDGASFDVVVKGAEPFRAEIALSGLHNVANALAAVAAARPFGLTNEELARGLATFSGVKRRQEERGTAGGITVIDDFAHHPTAVRTTLDGLRHRYPGRRLVAVFEPRSITAGRAEFREPYRDALALADVVAIARPFHEERLSRPGGPGSLDVPALIGELEARGLEAVTGDSADALVAALAPRLREGDVVLVMSSGSFGGIHDKLLEAVAVTQAI
ncbi:MAG: hypothetical protein JNK60_02465 [Acidobacteria bacterium]|nr:hypothetical protein [Acidobacteriota bacterium]